MIVIGVTGGFGSGKSKVLEYLREHFSVYLCQTDEIARKIQKKGSKCFFEIIDYFGKEILVEDGEIAREKLAKIVFQDDSELLKLNQMIHPYVKEEVKRQMEERKKDTPYFFLESALLIETGYQKICDEIWYVHADTSVRIKRVRESRGYSRERICDMMKRQLPEHIFYKYATVVIENSGDFDDTARQIEKEMKRLEVRNSLM